MDELEPARPRSHTKAPAAQRRSEILDAALRCFAEKGYHAATMDDLVRVSGLSKGSLYWHFKSKEEVFLSLLDDIERETYDIWDTLVASDESTLAVLRGVSEALYARIATPEVLRAWVEFLAHPSARARFGEMYRELRRRIVTSLEHDHARRRVRPLSPESVAASLLATLEGFALQALVDPDFRVDVHMDVTFELLEGGLCA